MQRARGRAVSLNILLAAAAAAILVAIIYGAQVFSTRTGESADSAFDVGLAQLKMNRAYTSVLEAESSQRGFLLTRDEAYLAPYHQARARADDDIAALDRKFRELGADRTLAPLEEFKSIVVRKFTELDQTIALAKAGKADEALDVVRGNLGLDLMTKARDLVAAEQASLVELRNQRVAALRGSARILTLLTTLGVIAVIGLSLIAILHLNAQTRQLNQAQEKLAAANEELEERVGERTRDLQRAKEDIQRYAYVVSHDLRAPLVNIIGFTRELETASAVVKTAFERIEPDPGDPATAEAIRAVEEDMPEALRFIQSSTSRMDNLINAILNLSRLGRLALRPQDLDLEALVGDCIASVQHRANEAGAHIAIDGRLPRLIGDRAGLEQIIGNLLDNAVKYLSSERPGEIVVRGARRGPLVTLEVADNGRGVAPSDHERIFELFRRAGKQDKPGDGIGLAHVRVLARRMGGDITIVSDGAAGSIFAITLPYDLRRVIHQGQSNAAS